MDEKIDPVYAMLLREISDLKSMIVEIRSDVSKLADAASNELLTPAEVCKLLKIGRSTYQRYVEVDKLFEQVKIKGKVYVKRSELERLIEQGKL